MDDQADFTAIPTPALASVAWRLRTQALIIHVLATVMVLLVWTLIERGVLTSPLDLIRSVPPMVTNG